MESRTNRVLIGTFVSYPHVSQKTLRLIQDKFAPEKIFIFNVLDDDTRRLITFNVSQNDLGEKFTEYKNQYKNTLRLHRNKETNTFYTINSLNRVIKEQNDGISSEQFDVDWEKYKNTCLVVGEEGKIKTLSTKLAKIIDTHDSN